jgi:pyruvate dehydrogenase E1 component beta subunit
MEHQLLASKVSSLLEDLGIEEDLIGMDPLFTGGNNKVFTAEGKNGKYFVKVYYQDGLHNRLESESKFIKYAKHVGVECVPDLLTADDESGIGIFRFIRGTKLSADDLNDGHIQQAAFFIEQLNQTSDRDRMLPVASEGCFNISGHISRVDKRLNVLYEISTDSALDREAIALVGEIAKEWNGIQQELISDGRLCQSDLPWKDRCISPSDFGFHNALLEASGNLCFLDFEYAGWDDPAKLVGDFFMHPAVPVKLDHLENFAAQAVSYSETPEVLIERCHALVHLCWIKWCCLKLNEFLPAVAQRHKFAHPHIDIEDSKKVQLDKARRFFDRKPQIGRATLGRWEYSYLTRSGSGDVPSTGDTTATEVAIPNLEASTSRESTFSNAVNEALHFAMEEDSKVIFYGLGADSSDPNRMFGTSSGLEEKFGSERVFDMPTSENGMTGIAIGAALGGYRPIMTHLRLDFFLLAMDQLVNGAAKWHYSFGGQDSVPITIRLMIGRGWGQGPTHSQSLHSWFAHIPGLKVVMPATPEDARGLLLASIRDDNPVVFIEHRWLHEQKGLISEEIAPSRLGEAKVLEGGSDFTVVGISYMTIEAIHAVTHLREWGINCDLIDLRTVSPIDFDSIEASVRKTGRLLVLDTGVSECSVASEIVAGISMRCHGDLRGPPLMLTSPNCPIPTSFGVSHLFYRTAIDIVNVIAETLDIQVPLDALVERQEETPHDVPGDWFKGPF